MNFDRVAPHYHWLEWLFAGGTLHRSRLACLDRVSCCENVLIIGEGDGRFLAAASQKLPRAAFTCVDASREMLRLAGVRHPDAHFVQARLPDWTPPESAYDLIVTHFVLDCLAPDELEETVTILARAAQPDALWLVADFHIPEHPWPARVRARWIIALAYWFFQLTAGLRIRTLTPPGPVLARHGFHRVSRHTFAWGLITSECWRRVG